MRQQFPALIIILLASLHNPLGYAAEMPDQQPVAFQSAGMVLHLEELIQIDGVVWALDFIDADTMIFTIRCDVSDKRSEIVRNIR